MLTEQNKAEVYEGTLHDDLGILLSQQGDHAGAERHFSKSTALHKRSGNQELLAFSLYNLSDALRRRGSTGEAHGQAKESRRLFASLGHQRGLSLTAARLASLALVEGDVFGAEVEARVALRIAEETGDRHCEAYAQEILARCVAAGGDYDSARPLCIRSLTVAGDVGDRKHRADTLMHAAEALHTVGAVAQAYGLLLVARAELAALGLEDAWLIEAKLDTVGQSLAPEEAAVVQAHATAAEWI